MASEPSSLQNSAPFLPFSLPLIGEEETSAVLECLQSGWLTTGPRVKEFEAAFAQFVGARHAVALNSGTAALHLALEAAGVAPGDEVMVPTMTFAATAEVVFYLGATPILVDCEPKTLNMDMDCVEKLLGSRYDCLNGAINRTTGARLRAIIPVHYGGRMCDMARLMQLASQYDIAVIEDAAHALPSRAGSCHAGTIGFAGAFSFYATKTLCTGEGGMLTTEDDDVAARVRMMSLHGISRDAWLRYTQSGSWYYEIQAAGFKYNLTDIAAALGLAQLRRANDMLHVRDRYARRYSEALGDLNAIETPPPAADDELHAWHLYPIQLHLDRLSITRAGFIEALKQLGIGTSVHFIPLHLHKFYREKYGFQPHDFPVANAAYERLISLPIYPKMSEDEVDRVVLAVRTVALANRR